MERSDGFQTRLLVVQSDHVLRKSLLSLLTQAGYLSSGAASLEEALAAVEKQPYALILADLFAGMSKHSLTPAHILRRRAQPIPLGLITTQQSLLEQPQLDAFAFVLPVFVDVPLLLTEIAACLRLPLDRQQERQARVLERFLEAWGRREWKSLLALYTEDVTCYPPALLSKAAGEPVRGKMGLLGLVTMLCRRYDRLRIEAQGIYRQPRGLALRCSGCVARSGASWEFFGGVELFAFAGERICQIGIPLSYQQRRPFILSPSL